MNSYISVNLVKFSKQRLPCWCYIRSKCGNSECLQKVIPESEILLFFISVGHRHTGIRISLVLLTKDNSPAIPRYWLKICI
jgi:hypothetical protein